MASWRIQAALVGVLALCGCGTADNFLNVTDAEGPIPYGGVQRDVEHIYSSFETMSDPDSFSEFAWSAAVGTAMIFDLPFSAVFDTLTLYPAYQGVGLRGPAERQEGSSGRASFGEVRGAVIPSTPR